VWLSLLIMTALRLLLYLVTDPRDRRKFTIGLLALVGATLTTWGLLITWWAREAEAPLDALLVAEVAVALLGVWTARGMWRSLWATIGGSGVGVFAGGLALGTLARWLTAGSHVPSLAIPTPFTLLRYVATAPAMWIVIILALATWRLRWKPGSVSLASPEQVYDWEERLARSAQVLRSVIEVGIQEQIIVLIVQVVMDGARVTHRVVEQQILESSTRRIARIAMDGGRAAYRTVEQAGLEGFLRCVVRTALWISRGIQRWHTGRLRHNLLWVAGGLALAVLMLVLCGW
jgi:hypothetical protein